MTSFDECIGEYGVQTRHLSNGDKYQVFGCEHGQWSSRELANLAHAKLTRDRPYWPSQNEPCDAARPEREAWERTKPHGPHEWNGDLGDEGYQCWGYPVPAEQPERFRIYRKRRP